MRDTCKRALIRSSGVLRALFVVSLIGSSLTFFAGAASAVLPITNFTIPTASAQASSVGLESDGDLWFAETATMKVGSVPVGGGSVAEHASGIANPTLITAGPDGNMWFAAFGNLIKITPDGVTKTQYPIAPLIGTPRDLVAGPDGNMWFTSGDMGVASRIGRMTTTGAVTEFPLPSGMVATGITPGPLGHLWFTAQGLSPKVGFITTAGVVTEFTLTSGIPYSIAPGPDGNLWVALQSGSNDSVARVTPAGVVTEFPVGDFNPLSIVAGTGVMWFSSQNFGKLYSIDMAGVIKEYTIPVPAGELAFANQILWFSQPSANKIARFDTTWLQLPGRAPIVINVPTPHTTIQAGIDAAAVGDTVMVAPGTYNERLDFKGKDISVVSAGGPDVTIIDGGSLGSVVTFDTSEGPSAVLQGFTIQHGDGPFGGGGINIVGASPTILDNVIVENESSFGSGGGMYVSGSPNIEGNVIAGNFADGNGGGIYSAFGAARIFQNVIASNLACQGAGLSIMGSVTIEDNLIVDNFVDDCGTQYAGAGIYATHGSDMQIIGNQIEANEICNVQCGASGLNKGAGIAIDEGSTTDEYVIKDNIIRGNFGAQTAGGIYTDADTTIVNNLIVENDASSVDGVFTAGSTLINPVVIVNNTITAGIDGTGIVVNSGVANSAQIYNNAMDAKLECGPTSQDVKANNATLYISSCAGALGINGNISQPLNFRNPGVGDYSLRANSASVNAGNNLAPSLPAEDITGRTRILDGTVDQGAFEFYPRKELDPLVWESPEVPQKKDFPPGVFGLEVSSGSSGSASASRPAATRATSEPVEEFILMGPAHVHERMLRIKRGRWRAHHDAHVSR